MSFPVELSDLPSASSLDPSDLMLTRKGLTDYKVAVSVVQNINIEALNPIQGGSPDPTDKMILSRVLPSTGRQNFYATFSQIGFPKNTKMWFYTNQNGLPPNWAVVPDTGDRLLAVATGGVSPVNYAGVQGGVSAGSWQQEDHALTIAQLPEHAHEYVMYRDEAGSEASSEGARRGKNSQAKRGFTDLAGQNQGHNHGNTWRPYANVGIIGYKQT